jgi:hypothetical protein
LRAFPWWFPLAQNVSERGTTDPGMGSGQKVEWKGAPL